MLEQTLDDFDDAADAAVHLVQFELAMLTELGFGLDLENCAATGETDDLIYVSPKSGGAVSRRAGEPWRDRLLRAAAVSARMASSAPATGRIRICRTASRSPACSCCAMCWSRAGKPIRTPAPGSSTQ